ncbi:Type II secretion system protein G precursor [Pseudobythopirellula maris]|uniref:Type II secretion system protein G n=1 Tax=Pseudobythopirellula maris TaxID=2527991 RepID=A0A5C5ZRP8_9BACT|nr:prepilin-type N-terminal cleavage/methylation domain-containing protein [Pseudobythopirellula maris]TWT89916.1 Type II secretion system protein G precursor [Pseudobythopirellula maris]
MSPSHTSRGAFSLLELMAVVVVLGVLAAIIVPRVSIHVDNSQATVCHVNKRLVESQAHLWWFHNDEFPLSDLSDIEVDPDYFPEGIPTCPIDGTSYTIDTNTGLVNGHNH